MKTLAKALAGVVPAMFLALPALAATTTSATTTVPNTGSGAAMLMNLTILGVAALCVIGSAFYVSKTTG